MTTVILIQCPDSTGLVAKITQTLFVKDYNIIGNWEFVDRDSGTFFMRTEIEGNVDPIPLRAELMKVVPPASLITIEPARDKKTVLLVTKEAHCLGDLLIRQWHGDLALNIEAVIGNHNTLKELVDRFDLPFYFIPHEGISREEHEKRVSDVVAQYDPDLLILAKYMRILSADFVKQFPQKIINIHHSFLPAFVGSKPYHQAHQRGVKIIGATAHFVTSGLDEGPIITQLVNPIDHTYSPEAMSKAGQDIEKIALAKAVKLVTENRVFINGNKTIVFE